MVLVWWRHFRQQKKSCRESSWKMSEISIWSGVLTVSVKLFFFFYFFFYYFYSFQTKNKQAKLTNNISNKTKTCISFLAAGFCFLFLLVLLDKKRNEDIKLRDWDKLRWTFSDFFHPNESKNTWSGYSGKSAVFLWFTMLCPPLRGHNMSNLPTRKTVSEDRNTAVKFLLNTQTVSPSS